MSTEQPKKSLNALEGITSIARKAVSGSVIKTGDEGLAIGGGGVAVGRVGTHTDGVVIGNHLKQVLVQEESPRLLSQDQAYDRINAVVRSNLSQCELYIEKAKKQSSDFFKLTLIFALIGLLILFYGFAFLMGNFTTEGFICIGNTVIAFVTAGVFFQKNHELRLTMGRYYQHILDFQGLLSIIDFAETLKDRNVRDIVKKKIIWKALDIEKSHH